MHLQAPARRALLAFLGGAGLTGCGPATEVGCEAAEACFTAEGFAGQAACVKGGLGACARVVWPEHEVDRAGGLFDFGTVWLDVPNGALSTRVTLRATPEPGAPATPVAAASPVLRFEPAGLRFAAPVIVSFDLPVSLDRPTVWWTESPAETFAPRPTRVTGDRALAAIDHFSLGFLGPALPDGSDAGAGDDGGAPAASDAGGMPPDSGGSDHGTPDLGPDDADAETSDLVRPDQGSPDGGPDAGPLDLGVEDDLGVVDATITDLGLADAGRPDAVVLDAGSSDGGGGDAMAQDHGPRDGGPIDAGPLPALAVLTSSVPQQDTCVTRRHLLRATRSNGVQWSLDLDSTRVMQRTGLLPAGGLTIDAATGWMLLPATGLFSSQLRAFIGVVEDPADGARAEQTYFVTRTGISVYAYGYGNQSLPFDRSSIPDVSKGAASYSVQVARFPASSHPCAGTTYAVDTAPTCPTGASPARFFTLGASGALVADLAIARLVSNGRYCVSITATYTGIILQQQTFAFDLVN